MRMHLLNTVLFTDLRSILPCVCLHLCPAFSRVEAYEPNHTKPRIYIMNTGTETISDMYYYYYFEVRMIKLGISGLLGTKPNYQHRISGGSLYRVKYTLTGTSVALGPAVAPDGNVIGIHYADWSPWNKTNDFSYNGSNSFLENPVLPCKWYKSLWK